MIPFIYLSYEGKTLKVQQVSNGKNRTKLLKVLRPRPEGKYEFFEFEHMPPFIDDGFDVLSLDVD